MLQLNITILLIILLLIYITISTLYKEVNYISVVTKQIKTLPLKRGNIVLPFWERGTMSRKNCNDETYNSLLLQVFYVEREEKRDERRNRRY